MICLRCGYCCKTAWVVVLIDPDLGLTEENVMEVNGLNGKPCPHLRGTRVGEFSCAIHDHPLYKDTPCASHGQLEVGNQECRMGRYLLDNPEKSPC